MANCRVSPCALSLSFLLSLPYRNALLVSSSRNICPRAALFPSTLFNPQTSRLYPSGARKSQAGGSYRPNYPGNSERRGVYQRGARLYGTCVHTRSAFEIILVDTHVRRLIALGFNGLHSRTKETAIRSTKRQAIVAHLIRNATLIIDN